jgi:hypothetical protein
VWRYEEQILSLGINRLPQFMIRYLPSICKTTARDDGSVDMDCQNMSLPSLQKIFDLITQFVSNIEEEALEAIGKKMSHPEPSSQEKESLPELKLASAAAASASDSTEPAQTSPEMGSLCSETTSMSNSPCSNRQYLASLVPSRRESFDFRASILFPGFPTNESEILNTLAATIEALTSQMLNSRDSSKKDRNSKVSGSRPSTSSCQKIAAAPSSAEVTSPSSGAKSSISSAESSQPKASSSENQQTSNTELTRAKTSGKQIDSTELKDNQDTDTQELCSQAPHSLTSTTQPGSSQPEKSEADATPPAQKDTTTVIPRNQLPLS